MNADVLTLHEAAGELGVHYMTVYRYVRLGLLEATKVGKSWQVTRNALESFQAGSATSPTSSRGARGTASERNFDQIAAPWAERLEARLLAADGPGAWGVVEAAQTSGAGVDDIYLKVLSPALVSIGERWESGSIDVAVEHRASSVALRLLGRLGQRCVRRGPGRGKIVIGAPAGEQHGIPVAMLSDLLRLDGWDVIDLGPNTPRDSFAHAASDDDVIAVGVSVTTPDTLDAAADACKAIREASPDILVLVGGSGLHGRSESELTAVGAHLVVGSAREMSDVVEEFRRSPTSFWRERTSVR